jgi:predicted nucleic acid-binding protein
MAAAREMFDEDFRDLCLAFEDKAADCYGELVALRIRGGKPISVEDAQIAAIAVANGVSLVTRNVRDFADVAGLAVINPWEAET